MTIVDMLVSEKGQQRNTDGWATSNRKIGGEYQKWYISVLNQLGRRKVRKMVFFHAPFPSESSYRSLYLWYMP